VDGCSKLCISIKIFYSSINALRKNMLEKVWLNFFANSSTASQHSHPNHLQYLNKCHLFKILHFKFKLFCAKYFEILLPIKLLCCKKLRPKDYLRLYICTLYQILAFVDYIISCLLLISVCQILQLVSIEQ